MNNRKKLAKKIIKIKEIQIRSLKKNKLLKLINYIQTQSK